MKRGPLSHSAYLEKRRQFRRWQSILRLGLLVIGIALIATPKHGPAFIAVAVLLLAWALFTVLFEVIAGLSYFREKRRQGYKIGPYADVPRSNSGSTEEQR
jgi:hypothetical protein